MKACATISVAILAAAFCAALVAEETAHAKGQTWDEVIAALGAPSGTVETRAYKVAVYPRQRIAFENGKVASVLPQPDAEIDEARLERIREANQRAAEQRYQELVNNVGLLRASPEERLRTWLAFSRVYPQYDVSSEIKAAREAVVEEAERLAQERRRAQAQSEMVLAMEPTFAERNRQRFSGGGFRHFGFRGDHRRFRGRGDVRPIDERGLSEVFRTPDPVSRIVGRRPGDDVPRFGRPDLDKKDFGHSRQNARFHHRHTGQGDVRPIDGRGAAEVFRTPDPVSRIVGGRSD